MMNRAFAMMTSGGQVKVILDGKHYLKNENAEEIYRAVQDYRDNPTEENRTELEGLLNPHQRELVDGPLERDRLGNYFLTGFEQPLSSALVQTLQRHLDEGLSVDPFVEFWKRLQLNPSLDARNGFMTYLQDHGVTITDEGYAMLYKAVNKNDAADLDDELVEFVGQNYLTYQRKRGLPSPAEVFVVEENGGYALVEEEPKTTEKEESFEDFLLRAEEQGVISDLMLGDFGDVTESMHGNPHRFYFEGSEYTADGMADIPYPACFRLEAVVDDPADTGTELDYVGRLSDLYQEIVNSSDAPFEPWYSGGNYANDIELGTAMTMPREKCDPNSDVSCSEGLHVGSHSYVESFGKKMDVILACVVNPRDIVALPQRDHSKIRTCRYFPYAIMERDEDGNFEEIESVQIQTDELNENFDYEGELENLADMDDPSELQQDRRTILENRVNSIN